VRNPEKAKRDRIKREDIVQEAERRGEELKQLEGEPHKKAACALRSHPTYGRYIRQTKTGKLMFETGWDLCQSGYSFHVLLYSGFGYSRWRRGLATPKAR
jgi:hypothetical protein